MTPIPKVPKVLDALIPLVFLIVLLVLTIKIFGTDGLSGSNQIVLILSATVAGSIAVFRLGYTWDALQEGVVKSISSAMSSILILFLIGALAGTWLLSGIVPAMIYYGLQVLSPALFLFAACFISAIVSTATGSSWTTPIPPI
jgi:NhaC family Na+:H+ antiporter